MADTQEGHREESNERHAPTNSNRNEGRNSQEATSNRMTDELAEHLNILHNATLRTGRVANADLYEAYRVSLEAERPNRIHMLYAIGLVLFVMVATPIVCEVFQFLLGVRCFVPNNYLVWEATRPISDCRFCRGVRGPLILPNLTREQFTPFAYSSQPIIIKNAVTHWPAAKQLNFTFLKNLYESIPGALDEDCQFLHFRTDFMTLRDVFQMSDARAKFESGHQPWYVGWSNCHPIVLDELRKLYPRPHFLPEDAEMPNTDYVFLGYEQGAIMHLDYIPRLMWQAQLQGNKSWVLAPTPECDNVCHSFSFYVEPGDAVLVDTRIWYHGTSIPKGQFALTIQSEYG